MEKVHGHEVMKMMLDSNQTYTKETLCQAILAKYGESVRFHTCSQDNMTASELVTFLEGKEKFVGDKESFTTSPDKICDH